MVELTNQLVKIEAKIVEAISSGNESEYSRLNLEKSELEQKIFFAESRQLKSDLENLETDRAFNISVRDELQDEAKEASDIVLQRRSELFDAEQIYQSIQAKQFFNDNLLEQQRQDINALKNKMQNHINSKLSGVTTNA